MDVPASYAHLREILLKFLGHPLCKGRDKDTFVKFRPLADLLKKIVHLMFDRTHLDRRVKKTGRPYNLFNHKAFRFFKLIFGRGRADKDLLAGDLLELVELERPVVCCGRKSESVFDQHRLAGMVAAVHGPDLRKSHMAFVDEGNEILRKIVDQAERSHALATTVEITGIVLYSGTITHFLYELEIIFHPLFQPLGFEVLSDFLEISALGHHVVLDLTDGLDATFLRGHEIAGRVYRYFV